MTLYRREVKYKWFTWMGQDGGSLIDETEWMSEEEAKEKGIEPFDHGYATCNEYERFIPVEQ